MELKMEAPNCVCCELRIEPEFAFCPRCGTATLSGLAPDEPARCMHHRHGVSTFCYRCGSQAFEDDRDIRRKDNLKWSFGAAICAFLAFVLIWMANVNNYSSEQRRDRRYANMAKNMFVGGIAALVGCGVCVFKLRFSRDREV